MKTCSGRIIDNRTDPEKYDDAMTRAYDLYDKTTEEKPLHPAQMKWTGDVLFALLKRLCLEQELAPVKGTIGYNERENWITAVRRASATFHGTWSPEDQ